MCADFARAGHFDLLQRKKQATKQRNGLTKQFREAGDANECGAEP